MSHVDGVIVGPRPGRMRSRRGRGARGPLALPGPLSPSGLPLQRTAREHFDGLIADLLDALAPHFASESPSVEVVVQDVPLLPPSWTDPVPAGLVHRDLLPIRVVVYRLPVTQRAPDPEALKDLAWSAVIEGLAEVWGVSPERLDPRHR